MDIPRYLKAVMHVKDWIVKILIVVVAVGARRARMIEASDEDAVL